MWQTNQGIRFKFHDKVAALEKLGRHFGMFKAHNEQTSRLVTIIVKEID